MARQLATNIFNRLTSCSKTSPPVPPAVWQDPLYFFAFGFGSGAMPFAPGTFGTLMAIPFYLVLAYLPLTLYLGALIVFIAVSSWACDRISRDIQFHDHGGMCIDEFVGFFVTMIAAPPGATWIIIGFILFRLFDIWKPWPIRFLDAHVHGGFGMVLDDIVAGIFAMAGIQLLSLLFL